MNKIARLITCTPRFGYICIGDIASQVWTHVIKEPVVREADIKNADGDGGYVGYGNLR